MLIKKEILAKKYARAFLRHAYDTITPATLAHIQACAEYLFNEKLIYAYLAIPTIPAATKAKALSALHKKFSLPASLNQLTTVLLAHKRIDLLHGVLINIIRIIETKHNILHFTVHSSHPLTPVQQSTIASFIKKSTAAQVQLQFTIDKELISGIKIKSNTLLWESSIAHKLREATHNALQRVAL